MQRINDWYGLDWDGIPQALSANTVRGTPGGHYDIYIGAVDTAAARRVLHRLLCSAPEPSYWLDLGNGERGGQVVLGQGGAQLRHGAAPHAQRLPCVTELYPELLDPSRPEDNAPSCSAAMSVQQQELFVNDTAAGQVSPAAPQSAQFQAPGLAGNGPAGPTRPALFPTGRSQHGPLWDDPYQLFADPTVPMPPD